MLRKTVTGERLAIRVDEDTLLAVPPMKYPLPRGIRQQVLEYVLRRQIGMAQALIDIENDLIEGRERAVTQLLSMRPNGVRRAA